MNVANLQLEGLYLAIAAINNMLAEKTCSPATKLISLCGAPSKQLWATIESES
jgi:hypothetical protein